MRSTATKMTATFVLLATGHHALAAGGTIWLEAELFEQKGGWVADGQFIEQMGSSYLLANGRCQPVEDAYTDVMIDQAGRYTLWVRCRNWLVDYSPGRFQVKVGPHLSQVTFGQQKDAHWRWVNGGAFELPAGRHRVVLHDLTGSYGRCDAIVLTTDSGTTPPNDRPGLQKARRELAGIGTTIKDGGAFDVVVVGGGVAGSCAAIASARHGAKTILIQDRPVLGGNASDEVRVAVQGAVGGAQSNAREGGLVEMMMELARGEATVSEALAKMAQAESNLTLCLLTRGTTAKCSRKGHIDAVETVHVVTGEQSVVKGKIFIDCTGDGVMGASAGAVYRVGREGQAEFKEAIAPERPDRRTLGTSLLWHIEDAGGPWPYVAPPWVVRFDSCEKLPFRGHDVPSGGHWWFEFGGGTPTPDLRAVVGDPNQLDTIRDAEEIRDHLFRVLYGVWDHCKNHPAHKARYANYRLDWVGHVGGKRESRRLIGDVIMTEHDILAARAFPDQVAYGGWSIDLHPPEGIYDPGKPSIHNFFPKPYGIPFRALYSKNVDNLMFAGRDISVSHVALGTTRVMATCGLMGQAVGTAAALCVRHDASPRQVGQTHIRRLQQLLLKDDGYLIGLRNEDPDDLARTAKVTASSVQTFETLAPGISGEPSHDMNCPRGELFRVSADRIDAIKVYVISRRREAVPLTMHLRRASGKDDFSEQNDLATATANVPAGHRGWVTFRFDCRTEPGGYYWFHLPPAKGMKLQLMREALPGCQRAYRGGDVWHPAGGHYAFTVEPPIARPGVWVAENVIDGVSRPVDDETHLWASDPAKPLGQWVELDLGEARRIAEVRLTFDSAVNARYVPAEPVAELVRGYRVLRAEGDRWAEVLTVTDNTRRHRVHRFEPVTAGRIRVEVLKTWGSKSARIFEIRLYGPAATGG
ncbi:MAG: FAD-dependent oxidoreductase [Phycisphaerae bacterium]|nr:FAD-dependent oxidoreductase [Phycisphaerae bacterium]